MTSVQVLVLVGAGLTVLAVAWLLGRVWPLYRTAAGQVRTLLGGITALSLALGLNSVFWVVVIVTPAALRGPGTLAYWGVLGGFMLQLVGPPFLLVWIWKALHSGNRP